MVERDTYPEIERTIEAYNGYWKKTTDLHFEKRGKVVAHTEAGATPKKPKRADADFVVIWPNGKGMIIEVKYKRHNFPFAEIRDDQRDLLTQFCGISWLWLFMGDRIGGKEYPRRAWIVPWNEWIKVENLFRINGLEGMAYSTPMKLEHRALELSAVQQLAQWELTFHGGMWFFPEKHPAFTLAIGAL